MKIFVAMLMAFILSGCSDDLDYTIDNPTQQQIQVRIDDKTYDIAANQSMSLSLSPGKHQLESSAVGRVGFTIYAERKGGMINPTLSNYIIVKEIYATDDNSAKNFRPPTATITLDGQEFEGAFQLVNGLFIAEQWSYGVQESFPESITEVKSNRSGNIVSKIFTTNDFINYYRENYGEATKNSAVQPEMDRKSVLSQNSPIELPVFENEKFQQASLALRALYQQYIVADSASEQKKLQSQYHALMMKYVDDTAYEHANLKGAESYKPNEFVGVISNAFGTGVVITSISEE